MTDACGRSPAAPHVAPRVFATVDSPALCARGPAPIDGSDDGLGETRGGPGQCRPSLGSTLPGRLSLNDNASAGIDARARAHRYNRTH